MTRASVIAIVAITPLTRGTGEPYTTMTMEDATRPFEPAVTRALVENRGAFLGFLERRVGDRSLAEDLLQEAFARGLDKLESLRDDEAVLAWFYRALRNAVADHYRRAKTAEKALERAAKESPTEVPATETMPGQPCGCVLRLTEGLKPEYAQAIRRIELDGVSVKAFAEELGISESNAGVRVFRAREALRRRLFDCCGACAKRGCQECTCAV